MSVHIDTNDPNSKNAAAEILRRHDKGEPEANITSAVRNFLTVTGLVKDEEIDEENPPAEGSRRAVDLAALDTFIEFKMEVRHGYSNDRGQRRQGWRRKQRCRQGWGWRRESELPEQDRESIRAGEGQQPA